MVAAVQVSSCVGGGGGGDGARPQTARPAPQPTTPQPPAPQPPAPQPPAPQPPARQPRAPKSPPPPPACIQTVLGCLTPLKLEEERTNIEDKHNEKDDFKNQWGLGRIRADRAWAQLELRHGIDMAPGSGQTVGVIDTGIDTGHPVFAGKTLTEEFLSGATDEIGDERSHGTAVAGVIAGRPSDTHTADVNAARGVAWGADIAMFAIPAGSGGGNYVPISLSGLNGNDNVWAGWFQRALNWSNGGRTIDFVNLSVGHSGIIDQYSEQELRDNFDTAIAALAQTGATEKTVFVWAAGNAHGDPCIPADFTGNTDLCESYVENGQTKYRVNAKSVEIPTGLPARIPELRGHVIAVVAIGEDGEIAAFSNRCGIAAQWCLAAPGVSIRTAYFGPHPQTSNPGARGAYNANGTSFAAPMVTGALVVMKHYFRDQMSNTALVERMLATANKTGIYAVSAIYGQGLFDLDAATTPVGTSSLALGNTVNGPGAPVTQTRFALGNAFGNGLTTAFAGQEVAAFDALGAPFWYNLGGFARAAPRVPAMARLDAFMAPEEWEPRGAPRADPTGLGITGVAATARMASATTPSLLGGFAPAVRNVGREGLRFGFVDAPAPGLGGSHLALARKALAFNADGPGGLALTAFSTEGMRGRTPVSGALLSWRPSLDRPGDRSAAPVGLPLKLTAGWMAERETMLGSRAAGAFGRLSTDSAFIGFDGSTRLGAWRFDASAEFGMAYAAVQGGMLTGLSPLISSAFAVRAERPLSGDASLQISVSQPLRVESGRARFSVPISRTKDGRVLRQPLTADLAPTGRQIEIAAQWHRPLPAAGAVRLGATWTIHPGHDAAAPSDLTLLAGWRHKF